MRGLASKYGDQLLAGGLAVLYVLEVQFSGEVVQHRASAAFVGVLMAASLSVRRTMPVLPLLVAIVVIQLNHTVLPGLAEGGSFMLAVVIAIFSAGAHSAGRAVVVASVLVFLIIPLAALDPRQPPGPGDWVFFVIYLGIPFLAGMFFRRRRARDLQLAERALIAERESEERAGRAVADERVRIARELHDVVAHAISVVVVQSRGGRRVLGPGSEQARSAFDTIEYAGEQALVEMRRLLAVLRAGEVDDAVLTPQPSLQRIETLVQSVIAAGLPVEVVHEGEPVELPPGVDLSAYRIVQEALTNAIKHAGPARACVILRYRPEELEIEVLDDGDGSGPGGGSGNGLDGIRERVGLYGGNIHTGRRPEGGYVVRASLPLVAAAP